MNAKSIIVQFNDTFLCVSALIQTQLPLNVLDTASKFGTIVISVIVNVQNKRFHQTIVDRFMIYRYEIFNMSRSKGSLATAIKTEEQTQNSRGRHAVVYILQNCACVCVTLPNLYIFGRVFITQNFMFSRQYGRSGATLSRLRNLYGCHNFITSGRKWKNTSMG